MPVEVETVGKETDRKRSDRIVRIWCEFINPYGRTYLAPIALSDDVVLELLELASRIPGRKKRPR